MQSHSTMIRAGAVAFVLLAPLTAQAVPVPAGLVVGQGYRLAFLSVDSISAQSSDISTYNSFVNKEAAQNSDLDGLSWSAIVSTATVSAVKNVDCPGCDDVPIFLVNGTELASSTTALFSNTLLMTAFTVDQNGKSNKSDYAWTGSTATGGIGSAPLGSSGPTVGFPYTKTGSWLGTNFGIVNYGTYPLYALSSEVFVAASPAAGPAAVPEPATLALLGTAAVIAAGTRRRTRRTAA